NRLFFCSLFQMILIFWIGAESLYNPLIVDDYILYFLNFLTFFYTFGFFWIFIDLWKYTKIEIIPTTIDDKISPQISKNYSNIISVLKLKNFKVISLVTFLIFLILNIIGLITNLFANNYPNFGEQFSLPGSQLVNISYFFYVILITPPLITIILLTLNYMIINQFSREKLDKIMEFLPRNTQIKLIENLKSLNNKIKKQINTE
ncbi:MAG: hypothetical protein ACFFDH_11775, partial [Promethearchaeota archaeon]